LSVSIFLEAGLISDINLVDDVNGRLRLSMKGLGYANSDADAGVILPRSRMILPAAQPRPKELRA
jgi:hypothetical protein